MDAFKSQTSDLAIQDADHLAHVRELETMLVHRAERHLREINVLGKHNHELRRRNAELAQVDDQRRAQEFELASAEAHVEAQAKHIRSLEEKLVAARQTLDANRTENASTIRALETALAHNIHELEVLSASLDAAATVDQNHATRQDEAAAHVAALERKITSLEKDLSAAKQITTDRETTIATLSAEKAALGIELARTESTVQIRAAELATLEDAVEHARLAIVAQDARAKDAEARAVIAIEELRTHHQEIQHLRRELTSSRTGVSRAEAVIARLENTLDERAQEQTLARTHLDLIEREGQELRSQLSARQTEVDGLLARVDQNEKALRTATLTIESLRGDVAIGNEKLAAAHAAFITELEQTRADHARATAEAAALHADALGASIETHAAEITNLYARHERETNEAHARFAVELVAVEQRETEALQTLARVNAAREELRLQVEGLHTWAFQKESELSATREARDVVQTHLEALEAVHHDVVKEREDLTARVLRLSDAVTAKDQRIAHLEAEVEAAKTVRAPALDAREEALRLRERALEQRHEAARRRELQVNAFAANVNRERVEMNRYTGQLADELKSLYQLHPLHDYLRSTERDLSKVEKVLRQTPAISSERPRLEACVEQLSEQRKFLSGTLAQSRAQLGQRAEALEAIVKGGRLGPIPQLPSDKTSGVDA